MTFTLEERFWEKVDKSGDCWIWNAHRNPQGYGKFRVNGKTVFAHRFSFQLAFGVDPGRSLVCHKCDNPPCVNPSHFFLGNYKDNARDAAKKGHHSYPRSYVDTGREPTGAKLKVDQVREIRKLSRTGVRGARLAERFNVSKGTISMIVNNQRWVGV